MMATATPRIELFRQEARKASAVFLLAASASGKNAVDSDVMLISLLEYLGLGRSVCVSVCV